MVRLVKTLKHFWKDEAGQSTAEYILILVVVAMIVIKFKEKFAGDGGIMDSLLEKMDSEISRAFTNN